jgi:hypothetical protein
MDLSDFHSTRNMPDVQGSTDIHEMYTVTGAVTYLKHGWLRTNRIPRSELIDWFRCPEIVAEINHRPWLRVTGRRVALLHARRGDLLSGQGVKRPVRIRRWHVAIRAVAGAIPWVGIWYWRYTAVPLAVA